MEWTNELVLPGGDVAASDRAQGSIFFGGNATVILSYDGFLQNFTSDGNAKSLTFG
jgi:hypothetical protein